MKLKENEKKRKKDVERHSKQHFHVKHSTGAGALNLFHSPDGLDALLSIICLYSLRNSVHISVFNRRLYQGFGRRCLLTGSRFSGLSVRRPPASVRFGRPCVLFLGPPRRRVCTGSFRIRFFSARCFRIDKGNLHAACCEAAGYLRLVFVKQNEKWNSPLKMYTQ
jgi:hypothetical protein